MIRLNDILENIESYHPGADLELVKRAYVFSAKVHQGQIRLSGEPYLIHPLEVAHILTQLKLDELTVTTGLLHDTLEDTHTTKEETERLFGSEITSLVDGLTKLSKISFTTHEERQAENFRKMIVAMTKDIRVLLIKLADRLHNMRTLEFLSIEKQKETAQETLDIYAPLANRLGIGWVKAELEDLTLKHLKPEVYYDLAGKVAEKRVERKKIVEEVKRIVEEKLLEFKLEAMALGRPKHFYSIYQKMERQGTDFDQVYDVIGLRIIVNTVRQCYEALGIIHSAWVPVPGRFKDYIALPKANMYQSLHTTIIGPYGKRVEIQIRTEEMNRVAEEGVAAHWRYKEGKDRKEEAERQFTWLRQLLEWQQDLKDPREFLETVKIDLFPNEVYVFTPKGEVREFPRGATPIDFAYSIHTEIGHRCHGAKVNGKLVSLKYELKNGDMVEILTSSQAHPSKDWLKFVKTSKARTKINHWLRTEEEKGRGFSLTRMVHKLVPEIHLPRRVVKKGKKGRKR